MADLKSFYDKRVKSLNQNALLEQVGHTVNGQAISQNEFKIIIEDIRNGLQLKAKDKLLDLCCGNGVITKEFSKNCKKITAFDFSEELIKIANNTNAKHNIDYINDDIFNLKTHVDYKFNKVLMFGSLQHFTPESFSKILKLLKENCESNFILFFGFVIDNHYKWHFYNTMKKKWLYWYRKMMRTDVMGTWWDKMIIEKICCENNLKSQFVEIQKNHYGYPYRFHLIIKNMQ